MDTGILSGGFELRNLRGKPDRCNSDRAVARQPVLVQHRIDRDKTMKFKVDTSLQTE